MKKLPLSTKALFCGTLLVLLVSSAAGQDQQNQTVTGDVTGADTGQPLPGANVVVKGTQIGTATDSDGTYQLTVPTRRDTLVFSFVGYQTREVPIDGRATIDVTLQPGAVAAEEVVVVGYATQQEREVTGAVSTVDGAELAEQPDVQVSSALQGNVPGVTVTQTSGQPGETEGTIRIRGTGTLGNANPLILIDGVEGSLNNIASSNIESVTVLKDAASAAIYGNRAPNGVILVTTKRGRGEISASYSASVGTHSATRQPEFVEGGEYMRLENMGATNLGNQPVWSEDYIQEWEQNHPSDEYPNTDWIEAVFTEPAIQTTHSVGVSGGTDRIDYRGSFQYDQQNGEIKNFKFERYNARLNTDVDVTEDFELTFDVQAVRREQVEPSSGLNLITRQTYRIAPIFLDRFSDGSLAPGRGGRRNPVAEATAGGLQSGEVNIFKGRFEGNYSPLSGLNIRLMYSPEYFGTFNKNMRKQWESTDPETGDQLSIFPPRNSLSESYTRDFEDNAILTTSYEFGISNHNAEILGGAEYVDSRTSFFSAFRDDFPLQDFEELNAASQSNQQNSGSSTTFALFSTFSRLNYNYNEKYLFEANLRYDGSSRFAAKERWGLFPAFSVGWRVSEEDFMESIGILDDLKIRGSWGRLGNQRIGNFPFAASVDLSQNFIFGGSVRTGAAQLQLANTSITWEETSIADVGVDVAAFDNRLNATFDWFKRTTDDILLQLPISQTVGLEPPVQNAGVVENTGWELSARYGDDISEDWSYDVSFNVSSVENEVTDLKGAGPFIGGNTIVQVGDPIDAIYGLEANGLFDSEEEIENHASQFGDVAPGDIRYVDQNGDGTINEDDRTVIGDPFPSVSYGLNLSASYKGFDARVFLQGVQNRDVLLQGDAAYAFSNGGKIREWQAESFWTPENPDDDFPRLTATTSHNNFRASDYWVYDGSYVRLRNVEFGYTLPDGLSDALYTENVRIYVLGQNLGTFFDNMPPGIDPNVPNSTTGVFFPVNRLYQAGINITF